MKEHYKGLGHIAIYTADMEQSIAFYENIGGSVFTKKRDRRSGLFAGQSILTYQSCTVVTTEALDWFSR